MVHGTCACGGAPRCICLSPDWQDEATWAKMMQKVLRSSYLHKQLLQATDALEAVAKAINSRMPGEPFGAEHELDPLGLMLIEKAPEVATLVRVLWCRPPKHDQPLGELARSVPRYSTKGQASRRLMKPSSGARSGDDGDAGKPSPWRPPPVSAYQLFARQERERLARATGRVGGVTNEDWADIGEAWQELGSAAKARFEAELRANVEVGNARVAEGRCAYLCARGNADLLNCAQCGDHRRCGHGVCFLESANARRFDSAHEYMCLPCLQAAAAAVRVEPPGSPSEAVVAGIELLVANDFSLSKRLDVAARKAATAGESGLMRGPRLAARVGLLREIRKALDVVAEAAGLRGTRSCTNAHGALAGLICAEHLRLAGTADWRLALAEAREFSKEEGLEQEVQRAHFVAMERLCRAASSGNHAALAGELSSRFRPTVAEKLVLSFVRHEACNALQLDLIELEQDGARDDDSDEPDEPDALTDPDHDVRRAW
jgi:hypothetical protein